MVTGYEAQVGSANWIELLYHSLLGLVMSGVNWIGRVGRRYFDLGMFVFVGRILVDA